MTKIEPSIEPIGDFLAPATIGKQNFPIVLPPPFELVIDINGRYTYECCLLKLNCEAVSPRIPYTFFAAGKCSCWWLSKQYFLWELAAAAAAKAAAEQTVYLRTWGVSISYGISISTLGPSGPWIASERHKIDFVSAVGYPRAIPGASLYFNL